MMLSPSFGGRLFGPTYAPRMAGSDVKTSTWSSKHLSAFQTLFFVGGAVLMRRCSDAPNELGDSAGASAVFCLLTVCGLPVKARNERAGKHLDGGPSTSAKLFTNLCVYDEKKRKILEACSPGE